MLRQENLPTRICKKSSDTGGHQLVVDQGFQVFQEIQKNPNLKRGLWSLEMHLSTLFICIVTFILCDVHHSFQYANLLKSCTCYIVSISIIIQSQLTIIGEVQFIVFDTRQTWLASSHLFTHCGWEIRSLVTVLSRYWTTNIKLKNNRVFILNLSFLKISLIAIDKLKFSL